jgi:predicted nucleic acid-binding protein
MRLVVADTGPLNYLLLIEAIDVLPKLFETILVPAAVHDELAHADAPAAIRAWLAQVPAWLEVRPNPDSNTNNSAGTALDEGERAAIALAVAIGADLILMDDRAGVAAAYRQGLAVTTPPARSTVANIIGAAIPILETTYHCDSVRAQRGRFASLR